MAVPGKKKGLYGIYAFSFRIQYPDTISLCADLFSPSWISAMTKNKSFRKLKGELNFY
jgi:hypothetical protein